MDVPRDLFTVHASATQPHDFELIKTIRGRGFDPTIMGSVSPPIKPRPAGEKKGPMPTVVAAALSAAKNDNKLLLIDFHASWCGPCKRMLQDTWPSPVLADVMKRLVFLKIDTDELPDVARYFDVAGLPDARLLNAGGKQLLKMRGFKTAKDARAMLEPLLAAVK